MLRIAEDAYFNGRKGAVADADLAIRALLRSSASQDYNDAIRAALWAIAGILEDSAISTASRTVVPCPQDGCRLPAGHDFYCENEAGEWFQSPHRGTTAVTPAPWRDPGVRGG
jgi:hypothetical protein